MVLGGGNSGNVTQWDKNKLSNARETASEVGEWGRTLETSPLNGSCFPTAFLLILLKP